ncbi:MAG: hypothetical protein AB1831_01290 [Pseudomonadota bacterium]
MRDGQTLKPGTGLAALLSALLIGVSQAAVAVPMQNTYLNPMWTDANKLHDLNNWGVNYWDDVNGNGRWDTVEPMGDGLDANWANPRSASDLSCWIASAANMLASAGFGARNAQDIYWDMVYNMSTPWHLGGWQYGGWQHEALNWYLVNRPHPLGGMYEVSYFGVYSGRDGSVANAWPNNVFDMAADFLAGGREVGIVIHGSIYHAVTFQGYDDTLGRIDITDSDQDAHQLTSGLDPYFYARTGPTGWWLSDYVPNGIAVDYFATLRHLPEPSSLALVWLGAVSILAIRKSGRPGGTPEG